MINYLTFNLLPYREEARQRMKTEFTRLLAVCAIIGLGLAFFIYMFLNGLISNQDGRNKDLNDGIAALDKEIKEVNELEREKERFVARKQKIEELQNQRYSAAMMFNDLNRILPEGVFLQSIRAGDGNLYELVGNAVNDNMIANFMSSIPSTGLFEQAELRQIQTVVEDYKGTNISSQQFTIETKLYNEAEKLAEQQGFK